MAASPQQTKINAFYPSCAVREIPAERTAGSEPGRAAVVGGASGFFHQRRHVLPPTPSSTREQRRIDHRETEGMRVVIGGWHEPAFHVRRALPQLRGREIEWGRDDDVGTALRPLGLDLTWHRPQRLACGRAKHAHGQPQEGRLRLSAPRCLQSLSKSFVDSINVR